MSATDTPTTPNEACEHPVANHYHGTHVCYVHDKCRCSECQAARTRYERVRKSWHGEFPKAPPPLVDAAAVVEHCRSLMDRGMGLDRIAGVAGVTYSVLGNVVHGRGGKNSRPAARIRRETAQKVLAVTLDYADGARVPRGEADAILAELLARGWTKSAIAGRLNPDAITLQIHRGPTVQAGTIRGLRALLGEPVPLRTHNPTGRLYRPNPDYDHQDVPATTEGVTRGVTPTGWAPGSETWLAEMRAGLKRAVEDSYRRHGKVAA